MALAGGKTSEPQKRTAATGAWKAKQREVTTEISQLFSKKKTGLLGYRERSVTVENLRFVTRAPCF